MTQDALMARARTYLASASLLVDSGDTASAISRAYYAMFYAAEAALLAEGLDFASHRGVIAAFGESFVKKGVLPSELGRDLSRMFKERQYVEYDATARVNASHARNLIETAGRFVEEIERHLSRT